MVTSKALLIGVENPNLKGKIADLLCILSPESQTVTHGWISNLTESCYFTRSQMEAFPKFVSHPLTLS